MFRNILLILLISGILTGFFLSSAPKAEAIDPVTIAILAPIALKAAQVATPYIIKGLKNMVSPSLLAAKDLIDLFKLPFGFGMVFFGWPFGLLAKGGQWCLQGSVAPFKFIFHFLMIPVAAFGVKVAS